MADDIQIQKMDGKSLDVTGVNKEKLKTVFPECFTEGNLDIDKLLSLCGEYIDNDFEKYKFEWKGKSECYRIAGLRSTGTLRPCVEESVDFENTNNLYIEGDNLEVLKLLQTAYYRKVKMIYIDPPYNTGNDFVYEDDFKDPMAKYKEITSQTTKSNPETMGRYHTNWLNMMYPRLRLASNLLRDDGVIFISIDDNEVTNLRRLCDEVFGEENFVAQLIWKSRQNKDNRNITGVSIDHEYVIVYSKFSGGRSFSGADRDASQYSNPDNDPRGAWCSANMAGLLDATKRPNCHFDLINPATDINYGKPTMGWRYDRNTMNRLIEEDRIIWPADKNGRPRRKVFLSEMTTLPGYSSITGVDIYTRNGSKELSEIFDTKCFDFPKPTDLIKDFIKQTTKEDDIVLDFFSGSATTAHAVMQLNAEDGGKRQFIMVQLPELTGSDEYKNICEIGKERIRRAGNKIKEQNADVDVGFKVLKLDTSNLVKWDDTPVSETEVLKERFDSVVKTLKFDRSELDVVYEVMLKLGIPITYKVNLTDINGRKVYSIGEDGLILVCLDGSNGGITPEDISTMCDLTPAKIVAAEEAFKDDVALSNAYYISKDKGVEIELL
ncbi:MAG: site-specific DNA-methyltransferase [Alphaproteobacteria bacterium]|nr:site-specific DNA-methyltransferase [Alphaproteobacteria bacterium]